MELGKKGHCTFKKIREKRERERVRETGNKLDSALIAEICYPL